VLEENATEESCSVVHFLWAKELNAKHIHKEMFRVYGEKCLSCKVIYNLVEKFSQGCLKIADDARPGAEVEETTVKDVCAVGFSALVKRWDKCINVGAGYVEK
jgi:hypothetical protein